MRGMYNTDKESFKGSEEVWRLEVLNYKILGKTEFTKVDEFLRATKITCYKQSRLYDSQLNHLGLTRSKDYDGTVRLKRKKYTYSKYKYIFNASPS